MGKSKIAVPMYKKTGYPRQQQEQQIRHIADTIFADLFSQASARSKRRRNPQHNTDTHQSNLDA